MGKAKKLKISKAPRNSPLEHHIEKVNVLNFGFTIEYINDICCRMNLLHLLEESSKETIG